MRGTRVEIFSEALIHNARQARRLAGTAKVLAMLKADAYGHGLLPVARILAPHVDGFGVALWQEAAALLQAGIVTPLTVVEGFLDRAELLASQQQPVEWFIHSDWQVALLCREQWPCDVWVKVNSGMNRLGFAAEQTATIVGRLTAAGVTVKGLASHLATADLTDYSPATAQKNAMLALANTLGLPLTLLNSAGMFRFPDAVGARVRPGIMLYGSSPLDGDSASRLGLRPTQRFSANIIAINPVVAGETVSYGGLWRAARDSRIAVVAVGYGDGYPRQTPSGTPVAIETPAGICRATTVGRVCMDMLTLDVTDLPEVAVGQRVELWGEHVPVDQVAAASGTLAYELFCRLTARPERCYR